MMIMSHSSGQYHRAMLRPALEAAASDRALQGSDPPLGHPAASCHASVDFLARLGILVAPGDFYGPTSGRHVRVALTATDERIAAAATRLLDGSFSEP
jgi:aspartate/methionine/tyrosine aminotransferase